MFATVYATFPDLASAEDATKALLERRLVACANLFPIRSYFSWKGESEVSQEMAALFKICARDFELVKETILQTHPYEVPCVLMYQIGDGHRPYLEWIRESTARPRED